ncbi:MAG: hypothetical protein M3165_06150 [Actinomycetota bacterium]|nr:hypothetical protein [Actinomycetota bacterium]
MSDEQRPDPSQPEPTGDYGYDMAHDFDSSQTTAPAGHSGAQRAVYVPTQTGDTDEDYSYDLAHDVPPQRPR